MEADNHQPTSSLLALAKTGTPNHRPNGTRLIMRCSLNNKLIITDGIPRTRFRELADRATSFRCQCVRVSSPRSQQVSLKVRVPSLRRRRSLCTVGPGSRSSGTRALRPRQPASHTSSPAPSTGPRTSPLVPAGNGNHYPGARLRVSKIVFN